MNTAPKRQIGALVFAFDSLASGATTTCVQKNNRSQSFIATHLQIVNQAGANSQSEYTLQVRDQGSGQDWFSAAVPVSAFGLHESGGILAADANIALREPWPLPAPYELRSTNQLLATLSNNGSTTVVATMILHGFYAGV